MAVGSYTLDTSYTIILVSQNLTYILIDVHLDNESASLIIFGD